MFLKTKHCTGGIDRYGQQWVRGLYLALFQRVPILNNNLRAAVRFVHLHQLGHFIVGEFPIGEHRIMLSGPIGHDGLPLDNMCDAYFPIARGHRKTELPHTIVVDWHKLIELPVAVRGTYWNDKGHNDITKSAKYVLNAWALDNLKELRKAGKVRA